MRILPKWIEKWPVFLAMTLAGVLMIAGCGGTTATSSNVTATPSFSPGGGTYNASQTVTISDATTGAVLYCTTDGTTPTTSSPQCAQPTTVFKTEFLQAIAVAPGKTASAVVSAGYTIDLNAAATPTFSPAGGTYASSQTVTITDATSGANIYYCATAGCTPTSLSTLYTGAITVSSSETLSAIAIASGYNNSGVASTAYTIVPPAAAPTFSPAGGPYTSAQAVTIADTTPGAVIHYTTDGTPATATSTVYTSPVAVTQSETINAIAVAPGYSSTTASAIYSINLQPALAPTFTLANNQLTISDATAGATIYYTTDGSQPSTSSTLHGAAPLIFTVTAGQTVNAIAVASGYATSTVATYTVSQSAAAQPTFSLASNQLTISDTTTGATIYYTIDGSQPSTSSTLHGAAPLIITVTAGQTVNAIAVASGYTNSAVATYAVTAAPTPSFSLASNQLTISDTTVGATIYYTTDGTPPSASSPLHGAAPVTITVTAGEAVNAIAVAANYVSSTVGSYTARAAQAPSFSLTGSQLTISDTTTGATIYYTTDGTPPTISSPLSGSSPITITVTGGEAVNAIAAAPNYLSSVAANYTVGATGTPEFSLSGGNLTIDDATSGAVIYYTINGSAPTTSSPLHGNAPVTVAVSIGDVVQAIALAPGDAVSALASYTVKAAAATPQITPNGGYFLSTQLPASVSITEASSGATVYYTTDGTTPSATNGTAYSASFTVTPTSSSPTVTVKAIAVGSNYNDSAEADSTFTLLVSPLISGQVVSGSTAISGATVQLYAAGTTGYASAPTTANLNIVGNLTTDASGNFALSYTCPAATTSGGDLLYLVATKDIAGDGSNKVRLMTALGSCNDSTNTAKWLPSITVNEATTIASAYALSAFAKVDTTNGGIDVGAPATYDATTAPGCMAATLPTLSWQSTGKETCNYIGLENAFAAAKNLVDIGSGAARSYTPDYPTNLAGDPNILNNSTVPTARVNALADMLASCVESSSGSGCSGLFSASTATGATPPNNTAPTDTLQAALNIAQNPGGNGINVSTLLSLVPATNQPYPTTSLVLSGAGAPTDLTLALTFTGAGLGIAPGAGVVVGGGPAYVINEDMAIDATGNIWVLGLIPSSSFSYPLLLAEFSNAGKPLTAPTTLTTSPVTASFGGYQPASDWNLTVVHGTYEFAEMDMDPFGNLWVGTETADTADLAELSTNPLGVLQPGLPTLSVIYSLVIDGAGNVWTGEGGSRAKALEEYSNSGTLLSPAATGWKNNNTAKYPGRVTLPRPLFFDANSNLWDSELGTTGSLDLIDASGGSTTGNILFNPYLYTKFTSYNPANGGTYAQYSPRVADASGNVLTCGSSSSLLDVNSADNIYDYAVNPLAVPPHYSLPTGRGCGGKMAIDGLGRIFAVTGGTAPGIIDEFSIVGVTPGDPATPNPVTVISPASGYTGTSSGETPAINPEPSLPNFGVTTYAADLTAAKLDGSGNLWVLNPDTGISGGTTFGNVLVEYVGIGAPVATPPSLALKNKQVGVRP